MDDVSGRHFFDQRIKITELYVAPEITAQVEPLLRQVFHQFLKLVSGHQAKPLTIQAFYKRGYRRGLSLGRAGGAALTRRGGQRTPSSSAPRATRNDSSKRHPPRQF